MGTKCEEWFNPITIIYGSEYTKLLQEPALFAVVFGYRDLLFSLMVECSLQSDLIAVATLYSSEPLFIEMNKGKLIVRNHATEREEEETVRDVPNPDEHENRGYFI